MDTNRLYFEHKKANWRNTIRVYWIARPELGFLDCFVTKQTQDGEHMTPREARPTTSPISHKISWCASQSKFVWID